MKTTKTVAWVVALSAAACGFLSCSEPPTACVVGDAGDNGFATTFTLTSTPQGCAPGFMPAVGDIIGMQSYHPAMPGVSGTTTYNANITTMAVQSDTLGNQVDTYANACYVPPGSDTTAGDHPYATGTFSSANPDANNLCHVTGMAPAVQDLPGVAAVMADAATSCPALPALPPNNVTYAWSNISVYVTAADQGNQFSGDVTITDNGCVATYHARGLWPSISCTGYDGLPNPDLCNPCAEPNLNRPVGSGITPEVATACVQIFSKTDPYSVTFPGPSCTTTADCAGTTSEFASQCVGGQCTYCLDTYDCGGANACVGGFCVSRTPYFCVLAGDSDPPVLNPNPPTCENSGGGGSSPGAGGSSPGAGGGTTTSTTGSGTGGAGTGGSAPADAGTD